MKIFHKVLAVICAIAVTGTMVLPSSMVNSITYAETGRSNGKDANSVLNGKSSSSSGRCGENASWVLDEFGELTISGNGKMYDYAPDSEQQNSPWSYSEDIKKVVIGDGITTIGHGAFYGCKNLKLAVIHDSVTEIGTSSFYNCSGLTFVSIPKNVTEIKDHAFNGSGVTAVYYKGTEEEWNNIEIGSLNQTLSSSSKHFTEPGKPVDTAEGTEQYRTNEFQYQINENEVIIDKYIGKNEAGIVVPDELDGYPVTHISLGAFDNISKLVSLYLPKSLDDIHNQFLPTESMIEHCPKLENIFVDESNEKYCDVDGVVYTKNKKQLVFYPEGRKDNTYAVLDNTDILAVGAFHNNKNIKKVILPSGLSEIRDSAFQNCTVLNEINIPDSVSKIGLFAFSGTDKLGETVDGARYIDNCLIDAPDKKDLIARDGTRIISGTAFEEDQYGGRDLLENIELPKSLISVNSSAFYWCDNLKNVYYHGTENEWNKIKIGDNNENLKKADIHFEAGSTENPEKVTLSSDDVSVSGVFDENTSLRVLQGEFDEEIKNCLPSNLSEIPGEYAFVYDISLYRNDQAIQPDNEITVSVKIPDMLQPYANSLRVYRIENDRTATLLNTNVDNGEISFATSHLSEYVLIPSQLTGTNTISIPDNVIVTTSLERRLRDGDAVSEGLVLNIYAITPEGKRLQSITVNGEAIQNGGEYIVGTGNVVIAVTYDDNADNLKITIPENVRVTRDGRRLRDGDTIYTDDTLLITADIPAGKRLTSLTVNGEAFENFSSYTVGTENVVIEITLEDIKKLKVTFPRNVSVTRNGQALRSGGEIRTDDILLITATAPSGNILTSLTVNGEDIENFSSYTVGTEDVVIAATFEKDTRLRITIPENVRVTRNGRLLSDGDEIHTDERLVITAMVPEGKKLRSLTVNRKEIESFSLYVVGKENVVIAVAFADEVTLKITIPDNVEVRRDRRLLKDGDEIFTDDVLVITADPPSGKRLKSLTVNRTKIEDGERYTVGTENVVIAATFERDPDVLIITIPENVLVTRNSRVLTDGDEISTGDIILITAVPPEGKQLKSLTVNRQAIESFSFYTVGKEDVVITATFENETKLKITVPQNVRVTRGIQALSTGDEIRTGDVLTITATAPSGQRLKSLTLNGTEIENNSSYTVGTKDVVIAATFENADSTSKDLKITIPQNVTVTRGNNAIINGDTVHSGDVLQIKATAPEGKQLKSLTVNGRTISSGATYTVGSDNVVIAVVFENKGASSDKYHIAIPMRVTVTRGNATLKNGDEISEGDVLKINATVPSGYRLYNLAVNGKSVNNGAEYTVQKENVVISVSFEKLRDDVPTDPDSNANRPYLVSNANIIGWNAIANELNSSYGKSVIVNMNGTTTVPAGVLQRAKEYNVNVILAMDDHISWSIKSIQNTDRDIDFQIVTNTNNIPEETIRNFIGSRDHLTLSMNHNGDLGLTAYLVIDVGEQYNNEPATLYWYNNNAFSREASYDVQDGKAAFKFTHASDWMIAFGKTPNRPTDSKPDDTSRPIDVKPNDPTDPDEPNNGRPTTSNPDETSDDNNENPDTGSSRISLFAFLALITSAAISLFARKQKQKR